MNSKSLIILFAAAMLAVFAAAPLFAQVALKTGSVFGKVVDDKGAPLPGVAVTLESDQIPAQSATSGPGGGFRFANLPPGVYAVNFSLEGFTEIRQEQVNVSTGTQVQLEITMKPSLSEEFTVIADTPVIDSKKTGTSQNFGHEYLEDVPSARDPWVIIDQTVGVSSDRYNVAGSESGQQANFLARGGNDDNNIWNYDGLNTADPASLGATPVYYDFDSFEELSVSSAGNDASVPTGGVIVNIVTKRAGNKWQGNGSFFFVNDKLQGTNTPAELEKIGAKSNRLDEVKDFGFDAGGPILKDRLFAWGAFHRDQIGLITVANALDFTQLDDLNFKVNANLSSAHETQFALLRAIKTKDGRGFSPSRQAPETLWHQGGPSNDILIPGIISAQHTWIPSDRTIVTGRYGYIGGGFSLIPEGGRDKQMIFLAAIPRYEQTAYYVAPIDRPVHDITVDVNHYKDGFLGGDHEFKFGFEYKTSKIHTESSYGNGMFVVDANQTVPGGPLTSGSLYVQHFVDGKQRINRSSAYFTDTFRRDRLTLNLGVRYDRQDGKNLASNIPGIPGFEDVVGKFEFPGNDPGAVFNDIAPRLGATYDVTGDGKTLLRGNFARYYDTYNSAFLKHSNPTFLYNGAIFNFVNSNGDRLITPDEVVGPPSFYGGWTGSNFDLAAFNALRQYDPNLSNSNSTEYLAGIERQISKDVALSVTFTHRTYYDTTAILPVGVSQSAYVPAGTFTANTILGNFSVPIYTLPEAQDGTAILTNIHDYTTDYNGVDIAVHKRMSRNFMVDTSLTLQRQKAHYSGGDSSAFYIGDGGIQGSTFPFDPTSLPFLNNQPYAFAPLGSGKSGVFPYSEWQWKFSGVYQFPRDISVGAFVRYQQGYPFVLFGRISDDTLSGVLGTSRHLFLVEPFAGRRFDNIFSVDLQFEKGFELGSYGRLNFTANVFNLTNANTVIRRQAEVVSTSLNSIDEVISPRAVRLGVRYSF